VAPRSTPTVRRQGLLRRCASHGVELTRPRLVVLEALAALDTHPTADEVHAEARRRSPRLGRATVYRTLELLARHGVLSRASHHGPAVCYDARPERHHHLVCLGCERIVDLADPRLDRVPVPDVSALGFRVADVSVHVRGLCGPCRRKRKEDPS
jgi:Fe2+ or Zn2+ uptake regulation protein